MHFAAKLVLTNQTLWLSRAANHALDKQAGVFGLHLPLLSAVRGFLKLASMLLGAMEKRGATVRQVVGRCWGM